jgi:hypothetical protein
LKKKLLVVFDIDDVLNNLMYDWLLYFNINNNSFKYDDIIENPPYKILKISKKKYLESLDNFREEKYLSLRPNRDILEWFEKYGDNFHFAALTSTPRKFASISAFWAMKYFGNWVRSFNFIPSKRDGTLDIVYDELKADWLYRNHADIFIDDSFENCKNAVELGIESYVLKQPWNNGFELEDILERLSEKV